MSLKKDSLVNKSVRLIALLCSGIVVFIGLLSFFFVDLFPEYTFLTLPVIFIIGYFLFKRSAVWYSNKTSKHLATVLSRYPLADEYFESLNSTETFSFNDLFQKTSSLQVRLSHEFEQLNQTDNYRKEFIGDISHELKTPIFSIQGYLETLSAGALDDPSVNRNFLYKALKNVERLTLLTNDLMEISKLESGELQPNFQVIPIHTIIKDVVDTLQYKAQQNEISLETTSEENNMFAYADRNQIRQVLTNLIDNAIKYNIKKGKVSVSCIYSNNRKSIQIQIRDTGVGITVEDIERVTERFFRVDKSRSRDQGGTGLGLSIVKHILEQHQQHLYISSNPGKGSTFLFHLKTARPNKD